MDGIQAVGARHATLYCKVYELFAKRFNYSDILRHLLLIASWMFLWRIAVLMEYAPHASLWYPPAGLSFAALLVFGTRALPSLFFCILVATFWTNSIYATGQSWAHLLTTGAWFGAAHCGAYGLGAFLLKFTVSRVQSHNLPHTVISFLVIGSLSALLATILGTQILLATDAISAEGAATTLLAWWVGDMAGTLVLAPLFIAIMSWRYSAIEPWLAGLDLNFHSSDKTQYLIKLILCASLLSATLIFIALFPREESAFAVFFLIIPQMWVVYTESPFRAIVSLALFSFLTALWVAGLNLMEFAMVFQFAIAVISASTYFGLAVPVLIAHNHRLREQAFVDSLTKVSTRDYFFEQANMELLRAKRFGSPLCFMLFDIDLFKEINDKYGHSMGDRALVHAARRVKNSLRQTDIMGRFGGDEFMILLPNNNLIQAQETAERLRQTLNKVPVSGTQHKLTGSFGLVQLLPEESISGAFERADAALLQAKKQGRNQIVTQPQQQTQHATS